MALKSYILIQIPVLAAPSIQCFTLNVPLNGLGKQWIICKIFDVQT